MTEHKQSKKQIFYEILRFLLIGGFATIVDYLVFYFFNLFALKEINSHLNLTISTALGFIAGLIINWLFSARFVYHYGKKTTNKQFIIYLLICLFGLLVTELGMFLASVTFDKLYLTFIVRFDFYKLFFKCLMTLIVLIINYLGRKFLVFNDKK